MASKGGADSLEEFLDQVLHLYPEDTLRSNIYGYFVYNINMARINYKREDYNKATFHLCQCHGILLRHNFINYYSGDVTVEPMLGMDHISFVSDCFKDENSLMERLSEMPSEWTVVQLSRCPLPGDFSVLPHSSPKLNNFFVTRLPCGSESKVGVPLPCYFEWPNNATTDILDILWDTKKELTSKTPSSKQNMKIRMNASSKIKAFIDEMGDFCFQKWQTLFLGKLINAELEKKIRNRIDKILKTSQNEVNARDRYLCYLFAEGCQHLKPGDVECGIKYLFPDNSFLSSELIDEINTIQHLYPNLKDEKRHSVILIVDEHLDIVPWECLNVMANHPVSRIPSIHFLYALFKLHKPYIRNGLREIYDNEVSYYVLNPVGDLPMENLKAFFDKRLPPSWVGTVGQIPSEEEWTKILTAANTFMYCGHGSGHQYFSGKIKIQNLKVKSIQLLFGCSSLALCYLGGVTLMTGESLAYLLSGSACTLGMLYSVTTHDTDRITKILANLWLPGKPIDYETLKEITDKNLSEPELLRVLKSARDGCDFFTNGAALIARGIPIKLVPSTN